MAQDRRQVAADSLSGATQIAPAPVPQPSLPRVNVQAADITNSPTQKMARNIRNLVGKTLADAQAVQQEADFLDGQIAAAQGEAFESLEMEGNKWMMTGYRSVKAQTLTANMLAAQEQLIRQSDFEMDPDSYRQTLTARFEQQLEGLDPQTARMVREQYAENHVPRLVASQTSAHMQYEEQQSFDATAQSIHMLSMDDSQTEAFVANALGVGGTAGLSEKRRQGAVTQGVIEAFYLGNPQAYAKLKEHGVIDSLPVDHQQRIEKAQSAYQQRKRQEFNAEFEAELSVVREKAESGEYPPTQVTAWMTDLYAKYGMSITGVEQKAAYATAAQASELYEQGNAVLYSNAVKTGDFDAVLALSTEAMIWHESRGNPYAVGPVVTSGMNAGDRALGDAQVMPLTLGDPGYGVEPAKNYSPKELSRVGRDYWRAMLMGSAGHKSLPWAQGDVEAAAVAYNAGPANAIKWIKAGRDYSVLPDRKQTEPYAKGILERTTGKTNTMSAEYRLQNAQQMQAEVDKQLGLENYEDFVTQTEALNTAFAAPGSDMTPDEYRQEYNKLTAEFEIERSKGMIDHVAGTMRQVSEQRDQWAADVQDEKLRNAIAAQELTDFARMTEYEAQMLSPDLSIEDKMQLGEQLLQQTQEDYIKLGVPLYEQPLQQVIKAIKNAGNAAHKRHTEQLATNAEMDRAEATGTVAELPGKENAEYWAKTRNHKNQQAADHSAQAGYNQEQQRNLAASLHYDSWVRAGQVDPQQAAVNTASLRGSLVAEDGNPSPQVVDTVLQYKELRDAHPHIAKSYFKDETTRETANALISLGAGDPAEGIRVLQAKKQEGTFGKFNKELTKEESIAQGTDAAIDARNRERVSGFEAWWFDMDSSVRHNVTSAENAARKEAAENTLGPWIADEIDRLQEVTDMPPEALLDSAAENVLRDSSFLGNGIVRFPPGKDFLTQALGPKAAEQFRTRRGIDEDILSKYIRENPDNVPGLDAFTDFAGFAEKGSGVHNLFAAGLAALHDYSLGLATGQEVSSPLGPREAAEARRKGIRPYEATVIGSDLYVVGWLADGTTSPPIRIDLRAAGRHWLADEDYIYNR